MVKKTVARLVSGTLRDRAEALLEKCPAVTAGEADASLKLLHELQVHQIELEMQNEGLRQAQAEIQAGLAGYADLYDLAPVAYLSLGRDGRIEQVNLLASSLLGMPPSQLEGKRFGAFVCLTALPAYNTFLSQAFAGLGKTSCELMLVPGGNQPQLFVRIASVAENAEQACRMVLFDITEQKNDEEELQLAALVYRAIGEAIMVTDAANQIIAINPAFTELTGYSAEEAIGHCSNLLNSGRQSSAFFEQMWHALETTGHWQGEILNRRKNGEIFAEWLVISSIHDQDGAVMRRVAMFSDITDRKRAEATIWRQANYDPLTGLPNRNLFHDRLQQEMKNTLREGLSLALIFIDLDHFKEINDSLGHPAGDQLLIEMSARISACVRDTDTVARLGGDEFTVILPGLDDAGHIEKVAQKILMAVAAPFHFSGETAHVSGSIGITLYPDDAADVEALIRSADQAMYSAKDQGRNRYQYFTAAMQHAAQARHLLGNDLRGAVAAGQLMVYYQPIICLRTGRCVKAEALLRWRHPTRGMVGPAEFIPLAEDIGLINEIGDWVFRHAASQVGEWREMLADCQQVSVNKSPRQFDRRQGRSSWVDYLQQIGLPASCINIEITEGLLLDDRPEVKERLLQFCEAGMAISLDDFGTGYSAMSYLKKFSIDYLKIDQSFIREMVTDPSDQAIVEAIIAMAHKLGLKVIAEGVETTAQREMLSAAGCDLAQGYLFAKPLPADDFKALLGAIGSGRDRQWLNVPPNRIPG
ncbi:MAG: EAL domain-containing protein [Azonexus sp.]|nr:EAL domain-containing protein [Azonexus sp.]